MAELDRREFLKVVGLGAGAAATAGCSDPVQKLVPYVVQPEVITPGIANFYASTCLECPAACGLHVRTREGRPVKLEGNPDHPVNRGALCARGQAGITRTYHPDRFKGPMSRGADGALAPITWDDATRMLADKLAAAGSRTRVFGGRTGPALSGLIDAWIAAVGAGVRTVYETFDFEALSEANRKVFGASGRPVFDLEKADYVIDFGADPYEAWLSPVEHARQIEDARDVSAHPDGGARLVYVGPRLSLTAGNADEWIPAKPGSEGILALAIARAAFERRRAAGAPVGGDAALIESVLWSFDAASAANKTGVPAETITRLGHELADARRPAALPPGAALTSRRAVGTAAAVLILNAVTGAIGNTVQVAGGGAPADLSRFSEVQALIQSMKAGQVSVLVVHDADPVYSLPTDSGFQDALAKVDLVVSTASSPNETTAHAHLILPDHTPLESWGDAAPRAGVHSVVQPTVRPLYDTQALGDTLLATARAMGDRAAPGLPEGSFRGVVEAAFSGGDLRAALAAGGVFGAPSVSAPALSPDIADIEFGEPAFEGDGDHLLVAYPSALLYDGRSADIPWLQETPDPVMKVAWDSWAEISQTSAEAIGVEFGDVVAISTPAGTIEVPVLPRGGIRDDVVAVAIGQGHTQGSVASRDGEARGVNVISVLPARTDESGGRAWLTVRARVEPTGGQARIPLLQNTDNKRGRQLGESVSLAALAKHGEAALEQPGEHGDDHGESHGNGNGHGDEHAGPHEIRKPYDMKDDSTDASPYRWAMTVDLDRCSGCSACIVACGIENNIPTVGEDGVRRGRQMNWLRIERWVGDGTPDMIPGRPKPRNRERLGDVDIRHSPMLCQQCGAAPCEPVCPVFATYHAADGLNGMIYNRCIGTRYCANNCPYKVRRFNYFDYQIENVPEPLQLMLNPDVTVRGQGVMEKCTFCVQRIQDAGQKAKDEGRPIADGEIKTACQQTCPTNAITFGNAKDEKSAVVSRAHESEARAYHALHVLNTRPAITYLSKVKRDDHGGEA